MNKVFLMGRLTADPETRQTQSGNMVISFNLAINRKNANGENDADFFRCYGFGKVVEPISKYLTKGDPIMIEGNLKTGQYTDKNYPDVKHYTTDVWIERFEFVPKNPGKEQSQQTPPQYNTAQPAQQYYSRPTPQQTTPQPQQQYPTTQQLSPDDFSAFDTSELPF